MKYLYPLSLMLFLLASCGKDEEKVIDREKTDWAFFKLEGDVKTISEKSYETLDGKSKGTTKHEIMSEHDRDMEFNEDGMLISEKTWTNDAKPFGEIKYNGKDIKLSHVQYVSGVPSLKTEYVWDKEGKNNLAITRKNADNSPFDKIVMKYKNSKMIERITYNQQGNPSSKVQYFYDERGNLRRESHFMSTDVVEHKAEYDFNDKKQKISEKHFNKDGQLDYETRYTYDGDKLAGSETYNGSGELSYVENKAYDKDGHLISEYNFDKFDGRHMRDVYMYDDKGNRTSWEVYQDDTVQMKVSYAYDQYGNLTKILATDSDSNVTDSRMYNYEYDKSGNWIKKVFIQNDRPQIISERKITYFE